jgi:AraC-like DNA-binding protein
VVGVHFKPWGLSPFIRIPSDELRNRWASAEAVWGSSVLQLRERIGTASAASAALQLVENELRRRLVSVAPRGLELVNHTAASMESSWGDVSIGSLADHAGASGNHLAAQYATHVGVTPKRLARIYRFARLILSVDARRPVDWSALAHTVGFFDQAHLSKEFKEFTGHTPTEYVEIRRRFPARPGFPPDAGPMPVIDFLQDTASSRRTRWEHTS